MKLRYGITAVVLIAALAVGGIAVALTGGGDAADTPIQPASFVGLELTEAASLAEDQNRPWRIARQDDEIFALTDDLVPGRVTFEIDDGVVTGAEVEQPSEPPPDDDVAVARADLLAAALQRLITVDNSFGGRVVFDDFRVGAFLGRDPAQPLTAPDRDAIAAALSEYGRVRFIADPSAEARALFDETPPGVAVLSIDRLLMLDDRAEIELSLWCGSLCGVYLTYEAAPTDAGWDILGTTGPIAVS